LPPQPLLFPYTTLFRSALQLFGQDPPCEVILIAGPLMDPEQKARLQIQAEGLKVRMLSHVFDNLNYMNAADLVITMAGYNSLCEDRKSTRLNSSHLVIS